VFNVVAPYLGDDAGRFVAEVESIKLLSCRVPTAGRCESTQATRSASGCERGEAPA
jgi:hypothetical protein